MKMCTLLSALPPGPVAVSVYVVDSGGATRADPAGVTFPTTGESMSVEALVEDQVSVTDSPFWMNVEDACRVTVGRAEDGTPPAREMLRKRLSLLEVLVATVRVPQVSCMPRPERPL